MSVADKLLQLNQVKQDIKTAIENKDVDMTGVAFTDYANKILDIGGEGITYEDYVRTLYLVWGKLNQFATAWEHSLTVVPSEISENSTPSSPRGIAQYPNGLTEGVIIPQGVTSIGQQAFYYWTANNQPLIIPNSVTSIGTGAFDYWTGNNQPLIIPSSLTSIGSTAFSHWTSNTHPLVIPDSVTSIGTYAFWSWTSNTHPIVIPNSVTSIGGGVFRAWELVPYVEIQAITPPTLANISAFAEQNDAPIYVPDESVDDYKTATNWVSLADRIFSINDK